MSDHQIKKTSCFQQKWAIIGLAGLCLSLGGFDFYSRQQLESSIQTLQMQTHNQTNRWGNLIDAQQTFRDQQESQDKLMASLKKTWLSVSEDEYDIWMIRESAALIEKAVHYDTLLHDRKTAVVLLELAQKRLRSIHDGGELTLTLQNLLKHLLPELKQKLPTAQVTIWKTFEEIVADLEHLPWPKSLKPNPEGEKEVLSEASLQAVWHEVKDLVRIRAQSTETLMPLIQDSEQRHWMYGLLLLIEQARWAWAQNNDMTYHAALQSLTDRLCSVFSCDANELSSLFQKIETLQSLEVELSQVDWSELLSATQRVESLSLARV